MFRFQAARPVVHHVNHFVSHREADFFGAGADFLAGKIERSAGERN
jgi:hypothetical protein